jgi:hypothetical protein
MTIRFETGDAAADISTTLSVDIGGTAHGTIGASGDHDLIAVDLVAGQTYTFAMVGIGASILTDSMLYLRDGDGTTLLASNDDGLQNNNSVIQYTATRSGRFYLDASGYGSSTGSFGIAATQGTKADYDSDMIGGAIDTHYSWSATRGTGTNLTFGFRDTYTGTETGFSHFTEGEKAATRAVLAHYAEVTNLTFTEVNKGGYTNDATLLYSNYSANDGAGAYGSYPGSRDSTASAGDVWVNDATPPTTDPGVSSWFREMLMHEVGHTMGLSHPGMYNAGVGVSITYDNNAQFLQDSSQYSVMSYFGAGATGASDLTPDTLGLYDMMALQLMYGVNMATRATSTIYGFGCNTNAVYDFAKNTTPSLCIWDGGGTDTLNASRYSADQEINLTAGTYSSIGGYVHNVSIAFGATIERAVGGRGADLITGNAVANQLTGGDGDDTLLGGAGDDKLLGGGGADHLLGGAGKDVLQGEDPGPTGTAQSFDLVSTDYSAGATVKATNVSLFPTNSFTIEMVWKQNDLVDEHYSLDIGNFSFYRYNSGVTSLMFWGAASQAWNYNALPAAMTDGEAHRVSISYDNATGQCHVYLDGSETWSTTFTPGTRALSALGNIVLDDDAAIGDLRIFDHARTAQEIWDNAWTTIQNPNATTGLVQNWVGDGNGHLVSTLTGHPDLTSTGTTATEQATLLHQGTGSVMEGGADNDTYYVYSLADTVIEAANEGYDNVYAAVDFTLSAGSAVERIAAKAGAANLALTGNELTNALVSLTGADTLDGGRGADALYGGVDAVRDVFLFSAAIDSVVGAARDKVYNFVSGIDDIDLTRIDANTALTGDQAFNFAATAAANGLWCIKSGTGLILRCDVTGDTTADMEIYLSATAAVTAADFLL